MTRPRAADDFAVIRARIEQLRRERRYPASLENEADRAKTRSDWRRWSIARNFVGA
jgi:hypothetical protein